MQIDVVLTSNFLAVFMNDTYVLRLCEKRDKSQRLACPRLRTDGTVNDLNELSLAHRHTVSRK
jgi:hypothetical protein